MLVGDLNESGAATIAEKIGGKSIKFDVTSEADWKTAVGTIVKEFGKIDILVNNAGWSYKNKVNAAPIACNLS